MSIKSFGQEKTVKINNNNFHFKIINNENSSEKILKTSRDNKPIITHTFHKDDGDCSSIQIELGNYDIKNNKIIFYTYWAKLESRVNIENRNSISNDTSTKYQDTLYVLENTNDENLLLITVPENSRLELPDNSGKVELVKSGDFNADKKIDKVVNLGACGTGGCMTGVFLNHHDNYYTLAFRDYLKSPEFETDKNGLLVITSSEEIELYNPSKRQISVFKLDKKKKYYILDKTFIHQDKMK